MSQITLYFISIGISLLFGIGVSLYLRKPLFTLLVDVCGTPDRGRFWLHVTILSYLLVSAAIGLAFQPELTRYQGHTAISEGMVYEELIYYENALHTVLDIPMMAICAYNSEVLTQVDNPIDVYSELVKAHGKVLFAGKDKSIGKIEIRAG